MKCTRRPPLRPKDALGSVLPSGEIIQLLHVSGAEHPTILQHSGRGFPLPLVCYVNAARVLDTPNTYQGRSPWNKGRLSLFGVFERNTPHRLRAQSKVNRPFLTTKIICLGKTPPSAFEMTSRQKLFGRAITKY